MENFEKYKLMIHQSKNNTDRVLKFYLTYGDYNLLMAEYEASGYSSVSAFLRKKIIGNGVIIPCVLHNDFIICCPKFGTTRP